MKNSNELDLIKERYESAKKLAQELWLHGDNEGTPNDFYYFQCGFVAGMNYILYKDWIMPVNQIFDSYDEAKSYSLTVPWKLTTCNVGESCWCRIILPTEKILYKNKVGETERVDEFEYIIPDGSVDKETAEYIVDLHNRSVHLYKSQKKRLEALQKLSDLDQELGLS